LKEEQTNVSICRDAELTFTALFLLEFAPIVQQTRTNVGNKMKRSVAVFHSTGQQSQMHITQDEASLPRSYQHNEKSLTKLSQKGCASGAKRLQGKTTK